MNDIPIEDHVRGVVSDLLKARGITKNGLVADIRGSRKIPWKGLQNKLSLQVIMKRLHNSSSFKPYRGFMFCFALCF
jgi:hypothetical protein